MTQQHTPGPWTFHRLEPDPHGVIMIGGWEISTRLYDVVGGSPGVAPIRNKADARLIAAAPDLLSLLQRAAPYMKTVSRNDTGGYSDNDPTLYEDILAAMTKASSQTQ